MDRDSTVTDTPSLLFIGGEGAIEIVANSQGWQELSRWCAVMAKRPLEDGPIGEARHVWTGFIDREAIERGHVAAVIEGEGDPFEALHWVMFTRAEVPIAEFLAFRDSMSCEEDSPGTSGS